MTQVLIDRELLERAASMELDTTARSIRIQDEIRAILAQHRAGGGVVNYLTEIAKEVGKELRTGAMVILIMLPIGLIVATPLTLLILYLPDWAWLTVMSLAFLWLMLGDAVAKGIAKARARTEQGR